MNTPARVIAQTRCEQARSDCVASIRHHGEREGRQGCFEQCQIIVVKSGRPIRREGIGDTSAV